LVANGSTEYPRSFFSIKTLTHFFLPSSLHRVATVLPPRYPHCSLHRSSPALFFTASSPLLIAPLSRSLFFCLFLPPSTASALLHCAVTATHCTTFAISSLSSFLAQPHRVTAASSASTSDSGEALIAARKQSTTLICALASFTKAAYSSSSSRDPGRFRRRLFVSSNSSLPFSFSSSLFVPVLLEFLFGGNGGCGGEVRVRQWR
ncbi:hypothetical protein PIB30_103241, partial [Stylosanthes scabra]|nr:hypothetical protein [Stylosanthes scabra]